MAAVPEGSRAAKGGRWSVTVLAATGAVALLIWAVGLASTTLEPWGDSPRAFYAVVADLLLGIGSVLLATAVSTIRRVWSSRLPGRCESVVYVASCIALAIPLTVSATNSYAASAVGEGGPSLLVIATGGIGLAGGLATLMGRRITLGVATSLLLALALLAVAVIAAR